MTGHSLGTLALLVCVVLAGCGGVLDGGSNAPTPGDDAQAPADPASDVLGWEDGYWHNESIDIEQADGLNETELRAYVARAMARIEHIRNREFKSRVPVTVMSRAEYRNRSGSPGGSSAAQAWNEQVWEAIWLVGEDRTVQSALSTARGTAVAGFYSPSNDAITIITPTPERPTIDNGTLVHELIHALQDQYGELSNGALATRTQDGELAVDSLIEGEANYVEDQYADRCGETWRCVPSTGGGGGGTPPDFNFGVYTTLFFPYSDGPVWVADQVAESGWSAVTAAYEDPPVSSEQIIHQTDEDPSPLTVTDTSSEAWSRYPSQGIDGADTVGEASIFAMFWYQSRTYGADVIDPGAIAQTTGPYDTYNYSSEPSAGWGNDKIVPYRDDDGRAGYVWVTTWDTDRDARQFHRAYLDVLAAHDAQTRDNGTYLVTEGSFADAFRVVRNGSRVTIVNGPDIAALSEIRARGDAPAETLPGTTTGSAGPGFGLGVTAAALLLGLVIVVTRRMG